MQKQEVCFAFQITAFECVMLQQKKVCTVFFIAGFKCVLLQQQKVCTVFNIAGFKCVLLQQQKVCTVLIIAGFKCVLPECGNFVLCSLQPGSNVFYYSSRRMVFQMNHCRCSECVELYLQFSTCPLCRVHEQFNLYTLVYVVVHTALMEHSSLYETTVFFVYFISSLSLTLNFIPVFICVHHKTLSWRT